MLRKLTELKKRTEGFTIIEVLIVLAIAALILVIVLVAIPQLQRNQRNTARKEVLSRISTEIGSFAGNNNGSIPQAVLANTAATPSNFGASASDSNTFYGRYLNGVNVKDPITGNDMTVAVAANATNPTYPTAGSGQFKYFTSTICQGEDVIAGSARNYALVVTLEGGARFCLDNK